ncbi:MAG: hypothetical protein IJ062_02005 [Firmicutes bacterium]|nr:hypothetical protein [Bacillota bacterium]
MAMSKEEFEAVDKKMNTPSIDVKCPRCGESLQYVEYPNGIKVYCKKDIDITDCIRGI